MTDFRESDFVPFVSYGQRWRFADFPDGPSSHDVEQRVRPFGPGAAAELSREANRRHPPDPRTSSDMLELDDDGDAAALRAWLGLLPVDSATPVAVSWDTATAVLTDWEFFVRHCDDFWYPAADDVTVWAPGAKWTLCFWHYGVLHFNRVPHEV